ncbi:dGTPase [Chromatiales bacterium (ex Bugula neritina AB1)]|nr:dGTPase [Chromatiales bacterium (ex Bugula neritina AB1)]
MARRSQTRTSTKTRFNAGATESHFQRDRARVIHSAWFRALQSKTQVLGLGESDFYRTRLTHSLEVAQIGSGICEHLRATAKTEEHQQWLAPSGLMDAACLAHDIGHSPFGHGGEVALNYMMRDHGGFEANGQSLRILARLGEYSENCGLDLTRRATLGIIKYPGFCDDLARYNETAASTSSLNLDQWHPPKGIYSDEADVLNWVLQPFSESDRSTFTATTSPSTGHLKTRYKSFDTSIMELADDIAYGVHDLEDAIAMSLLSPRQWQLKFLQPLEEILDNPIAGNRDFYTENLFSGSNKKRKHAISKLVGWLITHVVLGELQELDHPLLRLQARMTKDAMAMLKLLKKFIMEEVILRPELQALQYRGQQVVLKIFDIYLHNPERLLPTGAYEETQNCNNPERAICDYISGLTDASATRIYHRFSTPSAGSIFDRV